MFEGAGRRRELAAGERGRYCRLWGSVVVVAGQGGSRRRPELHANSRNSGGRARLAIRPARRPCSVFAGKMPKLTGNAVQEAAPLGRETAGSSGGSCAWKNGRSGAVLDILGGLEAVTAAANKRQHNTL